MTKVRERSKRTTFKTWQEVLRYGPKVRAGSLHSYYARYRKEHGLPYRCDMEGCPHPDPQEWNGRHLRLILDHIGGVNRDNRPHRLRLLCPNCNSQQSTHGGGNKGKVKMSDGGFAVKGWRGEWHYVLPAEAGKYEVKGQGVELHGPVGAA